MQLITLKAAFQLVVETNLVAAEINLVTINCVNPYIKNINELCDKKMAKKFDISFGKLKCL